ncbi:MAG: HMA2 domain-containing protein [Methylocystis sp.]
MSGESLPLAQVAHAMPGRARLRIADRRGDAAYFALVSKALSAIAGVRAVEVAPMTGSILIQHSGPLARIGVAAQEAQLFVVGEATATPRETTEFSINPQVVAALALLAAALWQMSRERFLPPAITLLWYASRLGGLWSLDGDGDNGE